MFFSSNLSFFAKNEVLFEVGKIGIFAEEKVCNRKKPCQPSKKHLCTSWRTEYMPVVVGHLVDTFSSKLVLKPENELLWYYSKDE